MRYDYCATIGFFDGVHRGHQFMIDSLTAQEIGPCDGYSAIATKKMVEDSTAKIKEVASEVASKVKDILPF